MAEPFADPSDVEVRWRPLSDAEQLTADALLTDASAVLRAQYPGIDAQLFAGTLDRDIIVAVVAGMVKTAMIGGTVGDGASQVSQTVGPYSVSASYTNPTGNLFITAVMDQMIRGYQPAGQSHGFANTTCHSENTGPGFVYGPGL